MKKIQLYGIGLKNAVQANELQVGDVMIYNYGYTSTLTRIEKSESGKIIYYTVLFDGKYYDRRTTATRLFAIERVNN